MGAKKDPKKDAKAPTKTPKKKEGGGGGKAKKKKWSKGKSRDKLNNLVLFDKVQKKSVRDPVADSLECMLSLSSSYLYSVFFWLVSSG